MCSGYGHDIDGALTRRGGMTPPARAAPGLRPPMGCCRYRALVRRRFLPRAWRAGATVDARSQPGEAGDRRNTDGVMLRGSWSPTIRGGLDTLASATRQMAVNERMEAHCLRQEPAFVVAA